MPDTALATPSGTHYRDGWVWPIADVRGWPVIREEAAHFPEILAHVPADRRRVAVQAGGNCGLMVRPIADAFDEVTTLEIDWLNYRCLCANVPDAHVTKLLAGLGSGARSWAGMMASVDNCGARRVMTEAEMREHGNGSAIIVTVDGLTLPVLDLLMLDVEGYELHALRGAAETIERCRPVIVVELVGHAAVYGISDEEIVGWLGERGYVCKAQVMRDSVFVWEPD